MPENNHDRIEDIKRHLYDQRGATISSRTHEGVLHPIPHDVPKSWKSDAGQQVFSICQIVYV